MQNFKGDESQIRDQVADETPNKQPNMTRWGKRFLLPYVPLWILAIVLAIIFLAVILWFAL